MLLLLMHGVEKSKIQNLHFHKEFFFHDFCQIIRHEWDDNFHNFAIAVVRVDQNYSLPMFLLTTEKPNLRWNFFLSSEMVFSRFIWDLKWLLITRTLETFQVEKNPDYLDFH